MKAAQGNLDGYRFVRVSRLSEESVIGIENDVLYIFFTSSFSAEDYFDPDQQLVFSKSHLKLMYKEDSIENVYRDYGNSSGFNRIK
jgi:hypothetical protein